MLVYVVVNKVNGKGYVGQTTQGLEVRWYQHCLLQGKCRVLESAIRKYGANAFEVSVVATAQTQEELNRLEKLTCLALNTYAPHGYNLKEGGGAKGKMHQQTKDIIRELALSPERREAFREMQMRPEVRAKQLEFAKKHGATRRGHMASGLTDEVVAKRVAASALTTQSAEYRGAQSELQRRIQADPELQARKGAAVKANWDAMTDEERAARAKRLSERLKGVKKKIDYSDEAKAKRSAIKTALWATPEHRAKMAARNADPELLKRRGDAIRAGHARNKVAKPD